MYLLKKDIFKNPSIVTFNVDKLLPVFCFLFFLSFCIIAAFHRLNPSITVQQLLKIYIVSLCSCPQFTFAKLWLLYAQFEIRQKNLQNARRGLVNFSGILEL